MPARTGAEYIEGLRARPPDLWIEGQRVADVTRHPAFRNVIRSLATLYDMQQDPALREEMTYVSPSSGQRGGLSFLVPRSRAALVRVRALLQRGGPPPDHHRRSLVAYATAADCCAENDPRFGENIRRYYEYVREHDLVLTHTLINPQANRSVGPGGQADPTRAARGLRETADGIVLHGARMLATLPIADEIMVFPSTLLKATDEDRPYAFAFAIPTATKGLRFVCRETFDQGGTPFDHPLGARFEEMDAVVIFDDVLVPWERPVRTPESE